MFNWNQSIFELNNEGKYFMSTINTLNERGRVVLKNKKYIS